jgi:hypothetical protein
MRQRRRSRQTSSLDQRLAQESQNLRKQAEGMPAGIPRDDLLRKARQAETASHVLEWVSSPGLKTPRRIMSTRGIFAGMQKKPWKIIAHIPGLDGTPAWNTLSLEKRSNLRDSNLA